jgi:glycosyltransferase involved in cell wall biosynthesis
MITKKINHYCKSFFTIFDYLIVIFIVKYFIFFYQKKNLKIRKDNKILYLAASCQPYHLSGYTIRTQEMLQAIKKKNKDLKVLTRPGYPWDRKDRLQNDFRKKSVVNNIVYEHIQLSKNYQILFVKILKCYFAIKKYASINKIDRIYAGSNYVNALPGLLAAKSLNIPFVYEMRGLWELTRISRQPFFKKTPNYKYGLALEGVVAKYSSRVIVISDKLKYYVVKHFNILANKIDVVLNCIDIAKFKLDLKKKKLKLTIGYAGSILEYEGLDLLIKAVSNLKKKNINCTLWIVGEGELKKSLENLSYNLQIDKNVIFFGKKSLKKTRDILKRCTMICLPRKPYEVCKIIPPFKLIEAMALGKAVVLPDLPIFKDEIKQTNSVIFFKADNINNLTNILKNTLKNSEKIKFVGDNARQYILQSRSWDQYISAILK